MNRRKFLLQASALSAAMVGFRLLKGFDENSISSKFGFGQLIKTPGNLIDLPKGFSYKMISPHGEKLTDKLIVPSRHDGMACYGKGNLVTLLRNHELSPEKKYDVQNNFDAFSPNFEKFKNVDKQKVYDVLSDGSPCLGGVSRIIYDQSKQEVVSHEMALLGTFSNCAGGKTPWGSWISSEETNFKKGYTVRPGVLLNQDHGYNFEIPFEGKGLVEPIPLKAMGRFRHEAVSIDEMTGIVYQTEDENDSLLYRYLPSEKGKLLKGGVLQALKIKDSDIKDTRNWTEKIITVNAKFHTEWVTLENVDAQEKSLKEQGIAKGCAIFARGEGICMGAKELFFACTSGGAKKIGHIWKYKPNEKEGQGEKNEIGGELILFCEPENKSTMQSCDNICMAPWGDLIVCEDGSSKENRIIGITPDSICYEIASNSSSEFAGCCFSEEGKTLFVNIQEPGATFAINGWWGELKQKP